jgi:hypothetical protein
MDAEVKVLELGCLSLEEPNFCGLCAFCNPIHAVM